jgi:hypothetical protein
MYKFFSRPNNQKLKTKKMKTILSVLLLACVMPAIGQQTRVNLYSSYVFDDKVDSYYDATSYYKGQIKGGYQWGAGVEFQVKPNYGVELIYLRQNTNAPMEYYKNGIKYTNFDLGINYAMIAGNRYFKKPGSKVEGFGGAMIGADIMSLKNPDNGNSGTKTKLAWGIRGGGNIWVSENVGIKLQALLLSAVQSVGGGFYFGTGGAGAGLSTYSSMYQFSLGGGLTFKLGGAKKPATAR